MNVRAYFFLIAVSGSLTFIQAQVITIPDAKFKAFLVTNYDTSGDGEISQAEAEAVNGTLNCSNLDIVDISGLEFFINVSRIHCFRNQLTNLPDLSSFTNLLELVCFSNQLTSLPNLSTFPNLGSLSCSLNQLTSLPDLQNNINLIRLLCSKNQLTSLPDLSALTNLQWLICDENQLISLPNLSTLANLEKLFCHKNLLTSLPDLSALTNLVRLHCYTNQLTSLPDLSTLANLQFLYCFTNQLTSLPDLSALANLQWLNCSANQLTSFPDVSGLSLLEYYLCTQNIFGLDDCPDIQAIAGMGLTFAYNPQKDGSILDCNCITSPVITSHPSSTSKCLGEPVTFSISVSSGNGSHEFQWKKNDTDINEATDSAYTIPSISSGDAALYTCTVINGCGTETSNAANLTVKDPVEITSHPSSEIACPGDSVTFSVSATGTGPLSFQWRKDAQNISGATASSFTIDPVNAADFGEYDCVIGNACGSQTSNVATLMVNDPVSITAHPQNEMVCPGDSVTFLVNASGTAPLSYQWRKDGQDISGATTSSYFIDPVGAADAGEFDCVIGNACGSQTSNVATLTVNDPVSITAHPPDETVCPGDSVTFEVNATGTPPLTFQWRKDGLNISGATTSTLTIDPIIVADAGNYDCVITNDCGSETSNPAILAVNDHVSIAAHPQSEMACPGDSVVFTVEAIGTAPLSYQWYRDGFVIPDANSADLTIDPVSVDDDGEYDCMITNDCGSVTTNPATLTVDGPLGVAVMPSSIAQGLSPLTMEAVISCALPPVSWEWQDLTSQEIFGMNENPVTLGAVLTETTSFEITVMDAYETAAAICTVLVSHETLFLDYNGDGCNTIHDLWELAAEWLTLGIDPNGDGFIDVRDLLYINTDDPLNCPE